MRYSIITPRVVPVVSTPVIRAREELARVMKSGTVADIGAAYARLEMADKLASSRRASAHAMRTVRATLAGFPCPPAPAPCDPSWERMCAVVAGWRR